MCQICEVSSNDVSIVYYLDILYIVRHKQEIWKIVINHG